MTCRVCGNEKGGCVENDANGYIGTRYDGCELFSYFHGTCTDCGQKHIIRYRTEIEFDDYEDIGVFV